MNDFLTEIDFQEIKESEFVDNYPISETFDKYYFNNIISDFRFEKIMDGYYV